MLTTIMGAMLYASFFLMSPDEVVVVVYFIYPRIVEYL